MIWPYSRPVYVAENMRKTRHGSKGGYSCGALASLSAKPIVFRSTKGIFLAERKSTMACYPRNASPEPCPRIISEVAYEGTIGQWLMTISPFGSIVSLSVENG